MADIPRISILLPVRDGAATLAACLASIRRQTEPHFECVVVDDASKDPTAAVASGFCETDPRFVLASGPGRGLVAALNAGLERCRGRYVARMDADDLMHRRRLADQADLLDARPELAAVGCHVRMFPRSRLADGSRAYEAWLNGIVSADDVRREAFVECPVAHPTLVLRREVLLEAGYRERGWPEDYDLVLRLLDAGQRIGMLPRRRLAWRRHAGQWSRRSTTYAIERFTACKAAFLAEGFLRGSDRYILWGHGGTGRSLKRALARHHKRPSHIVEVHPGRLGNRIEGVAVVPLTELPRLPRHPLVVSVAGAGPRSEIRAHLAGIGRVEGVDFLCAA